MPGCGRCLSVRSGLAATLAACLAVLASAVASEAAGNRIEIAVQSGYHGAVKLGVWMPITVDVTNHGQQLDGTLEIATSTSLMGKGGPPSGNAVYSTPLTLAPGATKHFRTYVTQDMQGSIDVRVLEAGRVVGSTQLPPPGNVPGLLVAVLSDDATALDGIAAIHPSGVASTVVHLAGSDLADSALVLRGFDLIAVDNFSTDTLTAGQRNALVDYVMQGGSLLIGTGGAWHKTLAGLPAAIVPMQVTGTAVLAASHALPGVSGLEVATGSAATGASAWLTDGDRPLVIEAPVGAGMVALSTFDWAQGQIAASAGGAAVLRQVVVRSTYGSSGSSASSSLSFSKAGIPISIAARGGSMTQALTNVPALDLPAWWLIGALVLVYVLLVGPINYFVLRAIGRRALAWITVPAIAVVASGGAYGASVLTKGTSVIANEIAIAHVQPGWDRAYNEAYTGIVAPSRGDYDVALGSRRPLISPLAYYNGPADSSQTDLRINTATGAITLPSMTAFTLRGFATEEIGPAPAVVVSTQLVGGQLKGTVKNVSSVAITDGVIIAGSAYQTFGWLAPGATASFSVTPSTTSGVNGNPIAMSIYPSSMCCGGPVNNSPDTERRNQMRSAVLQMISANGYTPMPVTSAPNLVLWTKQPFEQVTVNGARPRTYVESALVVAVPLGQPGTGPIPSGIVNGRVIDLDASLQPMGPPGLLVASAGSITYSFNPGLGPGHQLLGATLSSSNPFGPKFAGQNGPAAVKGEVWDWTESAWASVKYADGGNTSLPDSAINRATGEVRLRLSSEGQFSTGYMSMTGTVS